MTYGPWLIGVDDCEGRWWLKLGRGVCGGVTMLGRRGWQDQSWVSARPLASLRGVQTRPVFHTPHARNRLTIVYDGHENGYHNRCWGLCGTG
jgi:hypothetical protein